MWGLDSNHQAKQQPCMQRDWVMLLSLSIKLCKGGKVQVGTQPKQLVTLPKVRAAMIAWFAQMIAEDTYSAAVQPKMSQQHCFNEKNLYIPLQKVQEGTDCPLLEKIYWKKKYWVWGVFRVCKDYSGSLQQLGKFWFISFDVVSYSAHVQLANIQILKIYLTSLETPFSKVVQSTCCLLTGHYNIIESLLHIFRCEQTKTVMQLTMTWFRETEKTAFCQQAAQTWQSMRFELWYKLQVTKQLSYRQQTA